MFPDIAKYVIAALAVICIALAITVGVQTARIAGVKSALNAAILERDSLQSLSVSQSERLANINILLGEAEKVCAKRLETRSAVEAIFYKNKIPPPAILIKSTEPKKYTATMVALPPDNITVSNMENFNESVIPFDKSVAAIKVINSTFW